ncbi:DUF317 domain-containing protein [Peterkaempfera griseoplana]|uniref:DUF317 domain-containing protein n=1 Tax=Peterkaempfera griseoplana TaxID=66896 RepID=UPI0006E27AEC|nr:DUF317 domain-containing protein [Peterkaempfera griseoplana]
MNGPPDRSGEIVAVSPGYLGGPGDPDAALDTFLDAHPDWSRYRPGAGETTVAVSDCLLGRIQLDHEPDSRGIRWTIAAYTSPVGERSWKAEFDTRTPHEVVLVVACQLAFALAQPAPAQRDSALWGSDRLPALLTRAAEAGWRWRDTAADDETALQAPDGTAGLTLREGHERITGFEDSDGLPVACTLWAGPADRPDRQWKGTFTAATPTTLLAAALSELTDPHPALRTTDQIPEAHRALVGITPRPRRTAAAARGAQARSPDAGATPAAAPVAASNRGRPSR